MWSPRTLGRTQLSVEWMPSRCLLRSISKRSATCSKVSRSPATNSLESMAALIVCWPDDVLREVRALLSFPQYCKRLSVTKSLARHVLLVSLDECAHSRYQGAHRLRSLSRTHYLKVPGALLAAAVAPSKLAFDAAVSVSLAQEHRRSSVGVSLHRNCLIQQPTTARQRSERVNVQLPQ